MRAVVVLIFTCLPLYLFADDSPVIGRPKAPCYIIFKNVEVLKNITLYKITDRSGKFNPARRADPTYQVKNDDTVQLNYDDPGSSRGPLRIIAIDTVGRIVDSVIWKADEKNLTVTFQGINSGKLAYKVDESEAHYPYHLFSEEEGNSASVANRNRMILIFLSVTGFVILGILLYRQRSAAAEKST